MQVDYQAMWMQRPGDASRAIDPLRPDAQNNPEVCGMVIVGDPITDSFQHLAAWDHTKENAFVAIRAISCKVIEWG